MSTSVATYLLTTRLFLFSTITELRIGHVLGRGGFCVVNEVTNITLNKSTKASTNSNYFVGGIDEEDDEHGVYNIVQDRDFMEKHCIRKGKDCRYAIKKLQASSYKDASTFVNGINDLVMEFRFLAVIRHPNIIKMRAVGLSSPFDTKFFVIVDRLYDTLGTRINQWKRQKVSGVRKLFDRGHKMELAFLAERLTVAYDICCALKYMHNLK